MLWFKRQAAEHITHNFDEIEPASLKIELDDHICAQKLQQLIKATEEHGGVDGYIEALKNKQKMFSIALAHDSIDKLSSEGLEALLDTVFTARRKLPDSISKVPHEVVVSQVKHLLYGKQSIVDRMQQFVALIDNENKKVQRAAWDFSAELLHFSGPETFPLMSRWVWNEKETSGSLREFIRGGDTMRDVTFGESPADFEASRVWFAQQLGQQGFYRDIHYLIDLLIAQAYAEYILSMSSGMGMFGPQFGNAELQPIELVVKLLGIEPAKKNEATRLKKAVVH
ncbi:MAG: hypothetical protein OEM38_06380 [Gammaproteobacteria bacterium]|nr:hypothetical protein [Gammaproteobacteria bacterium]